MIIFCFILQRGERYLNERILQKKLHQDAHARWSLLLWPAVRIHCLQNTKLWHKNIKGENSICDPNRSSAFFSHWNFFLIFDFEFPPERLIWKRYFTQMFKNYIIKKNCWSTWMTLIMHNSSIKTLFHYIISCRYLNHVISSSLRHTLEIQNSKKYTNINR